MKKILVVDTETTGLPLRYEVPASYLDNWPRAVQIAWSLFEEDSTVICRHNHIIKPEGFVIPDSAAEKHGITTEIALRDGVNIAPVLETLLSDMKDADLVVAHNISFDERVIGAEFIRIGYPDPFERIEKLCTMKASTNHCKLDGPRGYKWPKLSEMYFVLFGETINETIGEEHNASVDVAACARSFFELVRLGIVELKKEPPTMNASELAAKMLEWEQKKAELDLLEADIKTAVLAIGKTYVVGNVRATYSEGRRTFDYELAAKEAAGLRLEFGTVCEENSTRKTDWKAVCKHFALTEDQIPFEQAEPSVALKFT